METAMLRVTPVVEKNTIKNLIVDTTFIPTHWTLKSTTFAPNAPFVIAINTDSLMSTVRIYQKKSAKKKSRSCVKGRNKLKSGG